MSNQNYDTSLTDTEASAYSEFDIRSSEININENTEDLENIDEYEDDDEEQEKKPVNVSEDFKTNIRAYIKIDNEIREKQEELKELKSTRKPCEEFILSFLDKLDRKELEAGDNKLRKNKSETKKKIDNDNIIKSISTKLKNPEMVKRVSNKLKPILDSKIKNEQVVYGILKMVETAVKEVFEDPKLPQEMLNEMEEQREKVVHVNLKRIRPRKKRNQ